MHELPATADKVKAGIKALSEGKPDPNIVDKYFLGSDYYQELRDIIDNPIENWDEFTNEVD